MSDIAGYVTRQVISITEGCYDTSRSDYRNGRRDCLGENWQDVSARLLAYENAVRKCRSGRSTMGCTPCLARLLMIHATGALHPQAYPCDGPRVAMSTRASELALEQAGLIGDPI